MSEEVQVKRKRTFKKFTYRGIDLDKLLDMTSAELTQLVHCRARRRFTRGLKRKPMALIKKLRKAKRVCPEGEKPEAVRTHLRNMIVTPEMVGSVVGIYNGKITRILDVLPIPFPKTFSRDEPTNGQAQFSTRKLKASKLANLPSEKLENTPRNRIALDNSRKKMVRLDLLKEN